MEILIFVSAGIAFGLLIVFLWNSDRDLKEKSQRLEVAESRLQALGGESNGLSSTESPSSDNKFAAMERQLNALTEERSQLLLQLENLKRESVAGHGAFQGPEGAEGKMSALIRQLADAGAENSRLRARVEELEREVTGREQKVVLLQDEQESISELRRQISDLEVVKHQLSSRLEFLESENQSHQEKIRELEALRAKVPQLEQMISELNAEKARLTAQVSELRSATLEKIKDQIDSLQALRRNLESTSQ